MSPKLKRLILFGVAAVFLATAVGLTLSALKENIVYFYTPSEIDTLEIGNRAIRIGGLVQKDSISIDWRLIFAPKHVLEYIIIHELCHLTVFNHSSKFWSLVDSKISNRKISQNWLKVNANYLYRIRFN